jgi:hypothetical protein
MSIAASLERRIQGDPVGSEVIGSEAVRRN